MPVLDKRITELPALIAPTPADLLAILNAGTTKKVTVADLRRALGCPVEFYFDFAWNTANLTTGVTVWTPSAADVAARALLIDAHIEVGTAFDGTTPFADISQFTGSLAPGGLWSANGSAVVLGYADDTQGGGGPLNNGDGSNKALAGMTTNYRPVPARFTTTDPLLLVVSQDGLKGGADPGASQGAATLFYSIAWPVPS